MPTLAAPAKLNLYLHIIGKRADGYHLLDSLVAFTDISDSLTLTPAQSLTFTADGPYAKDLGDDPSSNLVVRAAQELAAACGRKADIAFHLTKNLPVASGIGGGSADAAACLKGLAGLWDIDPTGETVRRVAGRLGADIPACVEGKAGFLGGIGTEIDPAPLLPSTGILLVNPGIGLPTPAVYRARTGDFSPPMRFDTAPADARDLAGLLSLRGNDLTAAAISIVPEIEVVIATLAAAPRCLLARMSGSGATCFGMFDDAETAGEAAAVIAHEHPDWWCASGKLLNRS
jgi:4-diphosphocytidyl-2-C-methyl-D-erythritol kinase